MVTLPSTLKASPSSFGFGSKNGLRVYHGKDSPPPIYRVKSDFGIDKNKGKSFGLSHTVYKKVHIPGHATALEDIPGPGSYDQGTFMGKNSRKFSIKSRIPPQDATTRNFPPPNCYHPEHQVTE